MAVVAKYPHRIAFQVDGETKNIIRKMSEDERLSESEILRRIVREWLMAKNIEDWQARNDAKPSV